MIYLLDISIVSALYDIDHVFYVRTRKILERLKDEDVIVVSLLTIFELRYSIESCENTKKRTQAELYYIKNGRSILLPNNHKTLLYDILYLKQFLVFLPLINTHRK